MGSPPVRTVDSDRGEPFVQPFFGSLAAKRHRLAHGFASPPHDGFAFIGKGSRYPKAAASQCKECTIFNNGVGVA
jgi:hypothetical protein